jgi:hypothetical protein
MIFQNATPIFLTRGTILNYKQGDFVLEKKVFATLLNYSQQTEDIVQGLPKIEELIEARRPKTKASLAIRPGVVLNSYSQLGDTKRINLIERQIREGVISCSYEKTIFSSYETNITKKKSDTSTKKKEEKKMLNVSHSIFLKDEIVVYDGKVFKPYFIPSIFEPSIKSKAKTLSKLKKEELLFKNKNNEEESLLFYGKAIKSSWIKEKGKSIPMLPSGKLDNMLWKYKNGQLLEWQTFNLEEDGGIFKNKENDFMVKLFTNDFIFLEYLNPITSYDYP